MKKKILAIGLVLVVLATVFACGCLEDYYTNLDIADAKLTEAMGYFSASMDLADQERFDAADIRLDEAVTAISMAEANIDDAKAMGAPKEETDVYDAAIPYVKSWIAIVRSTNNIGKLLEEMDEKGDSKDIYQKWITETDNVLNNLDSAEKIGLDIMQKYPIIASELEVAQSLRDIKIIKADCQAMKKDLQYITGVPTQIPTPIPEWYYKDSKCQIPMDASLLEWLTEYEWANKYERGEWDCSQMTAALEWHLENCGFETVMKQGTGPSGGGHAWVSIWLRKGTVLSKEGHTAPKDGYYIYEATGRYFVTDPAKWHGYQAKHQFNDIYAAWDYYKDICLTNGKCGEEAFLDEYGWWE